MRSAASREGKQLFPERAEHEPRVKVLIVHNRYRSAHPSGENVVVQEEAQLLMDAGCAVTRLEVDSDDISGFGALKKATLPGRVVWSVDGQRRTRAAIEKAKPDVVHFHNTFPLLSPSTLWTARQSGVPVVHTLHNFRPLCAVGIFHRAGQVCEECLGRMPLPALRHGCYRHSRAATLPVVSMQVFHRLIRTWQRCVDTFILPSNFARSKYIEAGWRGAQLAVKYNTAAIPPAVGARGRAAFVCVSRLSSEKGVDVLCRAWREAFADRTEELDVIGAGDDGSTLIGDAQGARGLVFRGQLAHEDTVQAIADARAVVVPSRCYEVFPRVVVEAYSAGTPVIASRLGSLAEVVVDGQTGLLVAPGDADALAVAMRRIAESPSLRRDLGDGARAMFESTFSPARTTESLLEIYAGARRRRNA